jgi:hypothetical protein
MSVTYENDSEMKRSFISLLVSNDVSVQGITTEERGSGREGEKYCETRVSS